MRQVAARDAPILRTALLQQLRNIGRSISADLIPPVGVVQPTANAAATATAIVARRTANANGERRFSINQALAEQPT